MSSSQPTTDKRASGKALRTSVPRSSHTTQPFKAAPRPDPITLLEKSNEGRLANLIPIRYARMLQSPFTFLRGAAYQALVAAVKSGRIKVIEEK